MFKNLFKGREKLDVNSTEIKSTEIKINDEDKQIKEVEEVKEVKKNIEKINVKDYLYDKTIKCPVCGVESKVKTVKSSAIRVVKKDSDFMIHYNGINPLLYEVLLCNECGYAGLGKYFDNFKEKNKEVFIQKVSQNWRRIEMPEENSLEFAIKQHKIALISSMIKDAKASEKAFICLKTSWLYRLQGDTENELAFQKEALKGFEVAYSSEDFPIAGLDKYSVLYLIGELNRRIGNDDLALRYFSEVITGKASEKIKEQAKEQKDLIKKL